MERLALLFPRRERGREMESRASTAGNGTVWAGLLCVLLGTALVWLTVFAFAFFVAAAVIGIVAACKNAPKGGVGVLVASVVIGALTWNVFWSYQFNELGKAIDGEVKKLREDQKASVYSGLFDPEHSPFSRRK